ncbi:hypothetical protein D7X96_17850 [Corallococcus interemptor]|uniref:Uncharacterized protein n=1 Tax=Corallococcus interemptor TaxID=2316720 RepID=A0A3A8QHU8_9BACT|nr:hypothetical protein [Corallococcus interemptor]RKH68157.1 hypothetical protein D7X96_17850 [Corallococcus interemptor]
MGAFFTNFQVHTGGLSPGVARERLLSGLRERLVGLGLVEAGPGVPVTRRWCVAPASQGPWLAVYDEATEGQDDAMLEAGALLLSSVLPSAVVGVRVHDSDVLDLWLAKEGPVVDRFRNWPGYFTGKPIPSRRTGRLAGRPEAWRELLVSGAPDLLRAAWDAPPTRQGASEILGRLAPLLGWDSDRVTVGFRSLPDAVRAGCTVLALRPAASPVTAPSTRLPALGHEGGVGPSLNARVGEQLTLSAVAHNTGGALRGLSIVLFGQALEDGLVTPGVAALTLGAPEDGREQEAPLSASRIGEQWVWEAHFSDTLLPEGHADPAAAFRASTSAEQAVSLWAATRVQVSISASAARAGRGELHIGLVPMQNPEAGQTSWTMRLRVAR